MRTATGIRSLTSFQFIFLPIAIGLLLPTIAMPWIVVNLFGIDGISPAVLIEESLRQAAAGGATGDLRSEDLRQHDLVFLNLVSTYRMDSLYWLSMTLYIISIGGLVISLPLRRWRTKIGLVVGIIAIISALMWFYLVETLKDNFAEQAALVGGLIGEEFRGDEETLADTILRNGTGPYVVVLAGCIATVPYFIGRLQMASSVRKNANHKDLDQN